MEKKQPTPTVREALELLFIMSVRYSSTNNKCTEIEFEAAIKQAEIALSAQDNFISAEEIFINVLNKRKLHSGDLGELTKSAIYEAMELFAAQFRDKDSTKEAEPLLPEQKEEWKDMTYQQLQSLKTNLVSANKYDEAAKVKDYMNNNFETFTRRKLPSKQDSKVTNCGDGWLVTEYEYEDTIYALDDKSDSMYSKISGKSLVSWISIPYFKEEYKKDLTIHSVKRLKDGVVFTVGDMIDCADNQRTEITGFHISQNGNGMLADLFDRGAVVINALIKYVPPKDIEERVKALEDWIDEFVEVNKDFIVK